MNSFLTSMGAVLAQHSLRRIGPKIAKSIARISSGRRILSAADDPAGAAIEVKLRASMRSTEMARRNVETGINMLNIAEGGLYSVTNIATRLRELAVQAASDGVTDKERRYLDKEFQALKGEFDRQVATTEFNDRPLLDGNDWIIQAGIHNRPEDQLQVGGTGVSTADLGIDASSIATRDGARAAIDEMDGALDGLNMHRARIGAQINILQSRSEFLGTKLTNEAMALSNVADADIAAESVELAKNMVLQQAAIAMLAQANQNRGLLLKLLN